jgi:hypothetical protein
MRPSPSPQGGVERFTFKKKVPATEYVLNGRLFTVQKVTYTFSN